VGLESAARGTSVYNLDLVPRSTKYFALGLPAVSRAPGGGEGGSAGASAEREGGLDTQPKGRRARGEYEGAREVLHDTAAPPSRGVARGGVLRTQRTAQPSFMCSFNGIKWHLRTGRGLTSTPGNWVEIPCSKPSTSAPGDAPAPWRVHLNRSGSVANLEVTSLHPRHPRRSPSAPPPPWHFLPKQLTSRFPGVYLSLLHRAARASPPLKCSCSDPPP
jgi:hypothetical protein